MRSISVLLQTLTLFFFQFPVAILADSDCDAAELIGKDYIVVNTDFNFCFRMELYAGGKMYKDYDVTSTACTSNSLDMFSSFSAATEEAIYFEESGEWSGELTIESDSGSTEVTMGALNLDFEAKTFTGKLTIPGCVSPSSSPSSVPSSLPSSSPSSMPSTTQLPSAIPSGELSTPPSLMPSQVPSLEPTVVPTILASAIPSGEPSTPPSLIPSQVPSLEPTVVPTILASVIPSGEPSTQPSLMLSQVPSKDPTVVPTKLASVIPSGEPSTQPSLMLSQIPSMDPTVVPTMTLEPSSQPSAAPTITTPPSMTPTLPCADTAGGIKFVTYGMKELQDCAWVASEDTENRCQLVGVSAACPLTCGTCTSCVDPVSDQFGFQFGLEKDGQTIFRDCEWVRRRDRKNRCALTYNICRAGCKVCTIF